ncbi:glycosyltransferase family 4 protein [Candidatus Woesearchaeota archaeon]|nr:glycosyltransferase family 4 protein [Candidatus Woesearchaeota archaeon]
MEKKNLAVIASRLKCVDAISVEAEKWIDKYVKLGYNVHLCAGKFGEPVTLPHLELPVMDYKHPEIRGVKRIVFSANLDKDGKKAAEILLNNLVKRIKGPLKEYLVKNSIQVLSIEDALISPKNLPLNMALAEIVSDLGIPTISRYHYVPWENPYFSRFDNFPKITATMPLQRRNVVHITNTESAKRQLAEKKVVSKVIPNTMDLDKLSRVDDYNRDFRQAFGIRDDQLIFLQPTRVKRNKFVERSVKLVAEINDIMKKDNVLLITGSPVYSRGNYFEEIVKKIKKMGVNVIFANDRIFLGRHQNPEQKFYSIHDAYIHSDFVIYPNTSDAFGNPVIEAVAYRKPLIVNRFPNLSEFEEKGFRFVVMDNKVTPEVISDAYELISHKEKLDAAVENNFSLLKAHYSSNCLDDALIPILNDFDQQKSFMSRFAGQVVELFPKRLWRKGDSGGAARGAGRHDQKKKSFKGKGAKTDVGTRKPRDLRNRKGGYKEPDVQEEKRQGS